MKTAIFLGGNSDIGKELIQRFVRDGWHTIAFSRAGIANENLEIGNELSLRKLRWDLVVCCIGVLAPIGNFFETDLNKWQENIDSNVLLPLRLMRELWPFRKSYTSVCFFSGAGTSNSARTYSAYSASKMMLYKMTELLDDEEPDAKFFILGPGMVRTKIQQQTLSAGDKADNYARVSKFMSDGDQLHGTGTSHDRIYDCLNWCMSLEKSVIGGRNVYVPDPFGPELEEKLKANPRFYKLRRHE